jgi:hypothetical protein
MQHQSQQGDGEGSIDEVVKGNGAPDEIICSEDGQASSKETYATSKASSARTSSTSTTVGQFSLRRPVYSRQPRQTYHRNNYSSRYGSRNYNNRSGWQAGSGGSYRPSYQPWTGSNSAENVEETPAYYEVDASSSTAEEAQIYRPQSESTQEIDPVVTLEKICNWLANILRKPDLARKLAGARLELGVDSDGKNRATFWLAGNAVDPRSFSLEYKSLIRMAFSTEVKRGYKLQLGSGEVVVPIE